MQINIHSAEAYGIIHETDDIKQQQEPIVTTDKNTRTDMTEYKNE